jgi:hypothetical protein
MRQRKALSRSFGIALLLPLLFALGCEQSRLKKLALAADGFSLTVRSFQQAEVVAHQQGLVSNEEHAAMEKALIDVANAGVELDNAVRVAHSRSKATAALGDALASLDKLLSDGVLHVKNPKARQDFQALILSAKGFLATISAAIG